MNILSLKIILASAKFTYMSRLENSSSLVS